MADESEQGREAPLNQLSQPVICELNGAPAVQDASPQKPSVGEQLETLHLSLDAGFNRIIEAFNQKIASDKFKEDQITRLHDELQQYKSNLLIRAIRPFVQGVIRLHDDTTKLVLSLQKLDPAELTPQRIFQVLEGIREDIELVLSQNGVEAFHVDGDQFDSRRQKVIKTSPTNDSDIGGRVADRIYLGFEQDGVILQKERVSIFQQTTPVPNEAAPSSATDPEIKGE